MKKTYLLLLAVILFPVFSFATHIIGGSLTYEHLGGATYRITLKLYKDCGPTSVGFPNPVTIQVRGNNGAAFSPSKNISIPLTTIDTLNPPIDTCAFNPGVCVSEAVYTKVVNNLPPNVGGYHLWYQICCRNGSIINLTNPLSTQETYYTYIPDNSQILTNSSPNWVDFPPVFVCRNQLQTFNHGATDKDGDSLVYSMYRPYSTQAGFTGNTPNFNPVNYQPGYSATNPMGGGVFSINPQTGLITFNPPGLGQHVVGVKCEEYRDGVKIAEILRDFQFNVLDCPPPANPYIGIIDACKSLTIQFTNQSDSAATDFFWDFGDLGSTTDTSYKKNPPPYTYPGLGTYTVMLIAQYGTACADTTYKTFTIGNIYAGFTMAPDSVCQGSPVSFNDTTNANSGTGTPISWQWTFGDGGTSTIPSPTYNYNLSGNFNAQLIVTTSDGCVDTITKPIFVQARPIVNAGPDTTSCINAPAVNLSGFSSTGTGIWIAPGSFSPSNTSLGNTYTPTSNEVNVAGQSIIILASTNNGLCPQQTDTVIITYVPGPTVNAGSDIYVCQDTAYIPLFGSVTVAQDGVWSTTGTGTFSPDDTLSHGAQYIPSPLDTSNGSVKLYLTTIGVGNCIPTLDSIMIFFTPPPTIALSVEDTICDIYPIQLNASSTTNAGYWVSSGTGTYNPSDTVLNTLYYPSAGDISSGSVTFYFQSRNNGGCKVQYDTITVAILPSPTANFNFTGVCLNDPTPFLDSSYTQVGNLTSWQWDFGNGNSSQQNPNHVFDTSGIHFVQLIVTSNNGCFDTIIKPVTVYHLPEADFGSTGICRNEPTFLYDSSTVNGSTITNWWWNLGNGQTSTSQNPSYSYGTSGTYNVQLIVQSAQGCLDTINKNITVYPEPVADYIADRYSMKIGEYVNFTDKSYTNIIAWNWDFGDGTGNATNQNPSYFYQNSGKYPVTLIVMDNNGCTDTTVQDFIVFMPPLVPSGFSPNGSGQNDVLYVLGGPFIEFQFDIYNNWGELIFMSNEQSTGWDGTKNGIEQPMGVYIYQVRAVTEDEVVHTLEGDVTLLR